MTKKSTFIITAVLTLFIMLFAGSCENSNYYDDQPNEEQTNNKGDDDDKGSSSSDDDGYYDDDDAGYNPKERYDTLSVAEFIDGGFVGGAFVKGYIVGDCTKSYKYAEFEPPFTNQQALLIADNPNERGKDYLLAIQLPQGKKRNALNLVDHPEYHKRKIIIFGYLTRYLSMAGIKEFSAVSIE